MILLGDVEHGRMIAHRVGMGFDPVRDQCISRLTRDGQLWGGTVYTGFNGASIWGHFAGEPGWMSPELIWVSFDYPFMQLQVKQILCTVGSRNEKALSLCKRLGYRTLYKIKDGIPNGGTLNVLSISKESCKWLRLRDRYLKANGHAGEIHAHL